MQASDNATAVMERPTSGETVGRVDPVDPDIDSIVGAESPKQGVKTGKVGSTNIATRFQKGNRLGARRAKSSGIMAARRALREAFHKALTPDKMGKAVRKMLTIINGGDPKAAVAAFKVLAEVGCIRGDSDSSRSGPSFTFILPHAGIIPEPRQAALCATRALPAPVDVEPD